jgi:hypothetical protein
LDEVKNNQNKEDRILIKTDERITELEKGLKTSTKRTSQLKETNLELICELIRLRKKYGEDK